MNEFLQDIKSKVRSISSADKVHLVLGNESCDLDSAVCAISHAYHLSQQAEGSSQTIFIPLLNVSRTDLPLRTEITHHIANCDIRLQNLVCKDEVDFQSFREPVVTLVDHNVPATADAWLDEFVVEVIDHHMNSRHDDAKRKISITREMVGSCSTLVARHILDQSPEILDHQLTRLLLGTILLDTVNMSEAAGRKTEVDEEVARRLEALYPDIDPKQLFDDVQKAKFDISGLTTSQMLKKDFKSASNTNTKVGISSITIPLEDVLEREDLATSLEDFCEDKSLDMNIIMTIDFAGTRQLAVYSTDTDLLETVEQRLGNSALDVERTESNMANVSAFHQHNRKASRKVVMPLVEEVLRTLENGNDAQQQDEEEPGENELSENVEAFSSNVNNANLAVTDEEQCNVEATDEEQPPTESKAEAFKDGNRLLPMSPFDKKSISVDESVTRNMEEEWDEKQKIINAIQAKQEEAERMNSELEAPSGRQMSEDTEEAMQRIEGVSVEDEWQDDEYYRHHLQGNKDSNTTANEDGADFYRRAVPKDERESGDGAEQSPRADGVVLREKKLQRPNTLLNRLSVQSINSVISEGSIDLDNISDDDEAEAEKAHSTPMKSDESGMPPGARPKEKKKLRAELSLNLDETVNSQPTEDGTTPAILTPTDTEMSWEDDTPMKNVEPIQEYTAREEHEDRWRWRKVNLGGKDYTIDMKAINPYKKVLSHGGYYGEGLNAIIVFASCYLPEKNKKDYTYVMNNLFLYVVSTLELLVAQEYIIVYFHGSANRAKIPSLGWMRKCYQTIDRKLRKSLKGLYLVHPTTWLKAIVQLTRPFISHKFTNKLKFVKSLHDLKALVPMEYIYVPEEVRKFDQNKNKGGGTIWGWIAGPPPVDEEDWFSLEEGYDSDYSITADFLLSPHNPPNWHRRRQRKRLMVKASHFTFSTSDEEEGVREEDVVSARHYHHHQQRRQQHHRQQQMTLPLTSPSSPTEEGTPIDTPVGIDLGPAISPTDFVAEWYFKGRPAARPCSGSGFIEDDTFSYNHIIATPEVERVTWKHGDVNVFDGEDYDDGVDGEPLEYDGEDEDEDGDCCDGNSATESHGQLELSS